MTIRSMPPASSHLALMPVPAPPPMIGRPAATFVRSRSTIVARDSGMSKALPGALPERRVDGVCVRGWIVPLEERFDKRPGEGGVVDVERQAPDRPAGAGLEGRLQLLEERRVRIGVEERL